MIDRLFLVLAHAHLAYTLVALAASRPRYARPRAAHLHCGCIVAPSSLTMHFLVYNACESKGVLNRSLVLVASSILALLNWHPSLQTSATKMHYKNYIHKQTGSKEPYYQANVLKRTNLVYIGLL